MEAQDFLNSAMNHVLDRAETYDTPAGQRSIERTVAMFNILTDNALAPTEGWLFLALLKMVRSQSGGAFRADNYEDMAGFAALAGEQEMRAVEEATRTNVVVGSTAVSIDPRHMVHHIGAEPEDFINREGE